MGNSCSNAVNVSIAAKAPNAAYTADKSNNSHRKQKTKPRYKFTYVTVNVTTDSTGSMRPEKVIWDDHRCYNIEAVKDFRPARTIGNFPGDCYIVVINGKTRRLFFDRDNSLGNFRIGRWYVLAPVN